MRIYALIAMGSALLLAGCATADRGGAYDVERTTSPTYGSGWEGSPDLRGPDTRPVVPTLPQGGMNRGPGPIGPGP